MRYAFAGVRGEAWLVAKAEGLAIDGLQGVFAPERGVDGVGRPFCWL